MTESLDLLDYRRRVAEIYWSVRQSPPTEETWTAWREARDLLFATHPQTPLEDTGSFRGLPYFPFDPRWRVEGRVTPVEDETTVVGHSGAGSTTFLKVGHVDFELEGDSHSLDVLWLDAYGGGLFIPFRDGTNGDETYGGGRYLIDSVKGADLGHSGDVMTLDFNYAYHPSCLHSYRWSCPLSPPANRLAIPVPAGEKLPGGS